MDSHLPYFSVIIPTYNRGHLIANTIKSVLEQDYRNFELLIVDDGSKDNTEQVVNGFNDERILYFKKENGERGAARNYGAVRAKGTYLNFFDSDDILYSHHLTTAYNFIKQSNDPEIFHLAYDYRTKDGALIREVNNFDHKNTNLLLFDNILSCNGVFLRKDIVLKFPFEEDRQLASSEDWELWIRLISRYKIQYSNTITSTIVGHDQRSIFMISSGKLILRDTLLIKKFQKDPLVMNRYGARFRKFIADRYTYFMLVLAAEGKRAEVMKWAYRSFKTYPFILLNKRFLASLKKLFIL